MMMMMGLRKYQKGIVGNERRDSWSEHSRYAFSAQLGPAQSLLFLPFLFHSDP